MEDKIVILPSMESVLKNIPCGDGLVSSSAKPKQIDFMS
jgi:hypothetical protein